MCLENRIKNMYFQMKQKIIILLQLNICYENKNKSVISKKKLYKMTLAVIILFRKLKNFTYTETNFSR